MADINWGVAAATTAGGVLVVSVAVALDFVGRDGPWALVPTAVGVVAGYVIYRVFGDGDPLAGVLS